MLRFLENISKYCIFKAGCAVLYLGKLLGFDCNTKMVKSSLGVITLSFAMLFGVFYPSAVGAEYSLEQLRIANTLINEAGGLGTTGLTYVAEVIRNQYNEQHVKYKNNKITYSDILYHTWKPGQNSNFENSRDKFANKTKEQLEQMGRNRMQGSGDWNTALRLADQMLKGTLKSNLTGGANAFHACNKKYTTLAAAQACEPKHTLSAINVTPKGFQNQIFYHWELGKFHHAYDSDVVGAVDPKYDYSSSSGGKASEDSDGAREASTCAMDVMQKMYLTDDKDVDKYCWYCKIVIVLVNAYLQAVSEALPATQSLGKIILKFGFLIWLAYYILQQVSSMNAVTPGKMLQDILVMAFKVALAYSAVNIGAQIIRDYYLDPIVGTGIDYGWAIFTGGT